MNGFDAMSEFVWAGQTWRLRPDRSAYWVQQRTLILADPHFGKAEYFRGAGIPVPTGTTQVNLERLTQAINETQAQRVVFLGDFFHSRGGVTDSLIDQLIAWRKAHASVPMINVRGNHDRQAGDPPSSLGVRCVAGPWRDEAEPSIAFAHEPCELENAATLCGHVHPGVLLHGTGKTRMRVACFHFESHRATLPAFGAFTGMQVIRPSQHDRVFAVGPDQVIEVSRPSSRRRDSQPCSTVDRVE